MSIALQIEITTRCNFDCFYCAGRLMRQGDMSYGRFREILQRQVVENGIPKVVSLQGEGEPTLHPDFFRMAQLVREVGSKPYTITNGTHKHPEHFFGLFANVGVSIDTLDAAVARQVGRYNLKRVIAFVESLASHLTVVIHSVAHKDHTPSVAAWCLERGYVHVVQPLQLKADYRRRYADRVSAPGSTGRFSCGYIAGDRLRYFTLDAQELPCPFIKDVGLYPGLSAMRNHQKTGAWPACCIECHHAGRESSLPG